MVLETSVIMVYLQGLVSYQYSIDSTHLPLRGRDL